jgi:MFS family permease
MRRSPLAVIFLTVFLDLFGFGIIIPILPYIAERYGATPIVVTVLMASYSLMQVLFAPLWGKLSDRVGRRPIILSSLGVSTVGFLLLGLSDSLVLVFAARILAGIGNANIGTAQAYVADVTGPEQRARGMGLIGMAFGLGFVFGPAVGGFLGGIAIPLPAYAAAALTALDLLLALVILHEPGRHRTGDEAGGRRHPLALGALLAAARRPGIGRLLVLFFVATFAFAIMESIFALFIEHRWFATAMATAPELAHRAAARQTGALLFTVGIVAAVVQGGLIGRLSRLFGERRLVISGMAIQAVGFVLMPMAGRLGLLYPIGGLMAVGNGLMQPSLQSLLSRRTTADRQGSTLGLGQSLSSLARVVGPLAGGVLFQYAGIGSPLVAAGAVMAVATLIALGLGRDPVAADAAAPDPGSPGTPSSRSSSSS